jgi:penicillin amidase
LRSEDEQVEEALEMLRGWDCVLSASSAPAALFEVWYRLHLRPALFERALAGVVPPEKLAEAVAAATPLEDLAADARADLDLIEEPDGRLGPEPKKALAEVMLSSLGRAVEHLEGLLGSDRDAWEWGRLHHALLAHPLSALAGEEAHERLDVGPAPRGGSGDTVGNTAYRADFRQTGGSSFRIVVDVGEWDESLFMNAPGQSGDPGSPHYSDLFEGWAANDAFPLLYSREKIEAVTEERILLEPQGR